MQIFTRILFVALALGSMTLSAAVAQSLNNEPAQTLEEVANTELDVVLALPDADLSGYTKLILPPLEVEYQRGNSRMCTV